MSTEQARQAAAEVLWAREGGPCVSMLVSALVELSKSTSHVHTGGHYWDESDNEALRSIQSRLDYVEAVEDQDEWELFEDEEQGGWWSWRSIDSDGEETSRGDIYETKEEAAEACVVEFGGDPYEHEAYEHWIVSSWLARKLEAEGEMVAEICGLWIWGRCTTGQSIVLDHCMQEIAAGLGWAQESEVTK